MHKTRFYTKIIHKNAKKVLQFQADRRILEALVEQNGVKMSKNHQSGGSERRGERDRHL